MVTKHGMKARIGRELGITGAAVAKLAKRGMPLDSADAARRWRAAHLASHRMKADPGPSPETLAQRANELAALATSAMGGHGFELLAHELRAAMRAVPLSHRPQVGMSFDLWRALMGDYTMAVLDEGRSPTPQEMSDEDANEVGAICYQLACGEAAIT
jgi:hypothetical protein